MRGMKVKALECSLGSFRSRIGPFAGYLLTDDLKCEKISCTIGPGKECKECKAATESSAKEGLNDKWVGMKSCVKIEVGPGGLVGVVPSRRI